MRFSIVHTSDYSYSRPVFLEPHTIRLRPRADGSHHLLDYDLAIVPQPAGRADFLDPEGNAVTRVWFEDLTPSLRVTARMDVRNELDNPFSFLIDPAAEHLPVRYGPDIEPHLAPYVQRLAPVPDPVRDFAEAVAGESGSGTLSFLTLLTNRTYERFSTIVREEGDPFPAHDTLAREEGSCRDLAVLCMDACRAMGLAARFVSGFEAGDPETPERYLHAWAEVYLPRGGWCGLDPTQGLMVADTYVPVAAAALPPNAAPITGSFRGTEATSTLTNTLTVDRLDG